MTATITPTAEYVGREFITSEEPRRGAASAPGKNKAKAEDHCHIAGVVAADCGSNRRLHVLEVFGGPESS